MYLIIMHVKSVPLNDFLGLWMLEESEELKPFDGLGYEGYK